MRRKEREVRDEGKIRSVIDSCKVLRLGLYDGEEVYIVPLSFGCEEKDGELIFYFHSAPEGRKSDIISEGNHGASAGFELDSSAEVTEGKIACGYSMHYQSIIGTGEISAVEDAGAKAHALRRIMLHNTGKEDWEFSEAALKAVAVYRLRVTKLTCKENI